MKHPNVRYMYSCNNVWSIINCESIHCWCLQVLDRDAQMDNPCKWLDETCWDNITELDK